MKKFFLSLILVLSIYSLLFAQEDVEKKFYKNGLTLALKGNFIAAEKEFNSALKVDHPFNSPIKTALQLIQDVDSKKITKEYALLIFQATDFGNNKQMDKAIESLTKAITLNSKYVMAYNLRGSMYAMKQEYKVALEDFNKAIQFDASYAKTYLNRANLYSLLSEYPKAFNDFSKALELNPRYQEVFYNRGLLYARNKQFELAVIDFSKAISLYAKYTSAYFSRAMVYSDMKQYALAVKDFDAILEYENNNKNLLVYFYKAQALEKSELLNQALENYKFFLQLAPTVDNYQIYKRYIDIAKVNVSSIEKNINLNLKK